MPAKSYFKFFRTRKSQWGQKLKKYPIIAVLALGLILGFTGLLPVSADDWPEPYESYLNYIGTRPSEAETKYAEEAQGLAHDENNWFISQVWALWKIPVDLDLAGNIQCDTPGVVCSNLDYVNELEEFNHVGDIDYYQYDESTGFLLLPLEGGPNPAIAAFDPDNLQYIAHAELPNHNSISWVAVDADGLVCTSSNDKSGWVYTYRVDWEALARNGAMSLEKVGEFPLLDESGNLLTIGPQGGVFSPSGNLLYVNNGYYESYNSHKDGISVFDMGTKRRIAHSTMASEEPFWYGYNPGFATYEEPEGLTIWDLDADPRAPNISGQLHVLLLDNDVWGDDIYIRHYTNRIYVDSGYTGEELGDPTKPFNTVGEANNFAWYGARIIIKAGTYPESLTFSKQLQLLADGGTVSFGTGGYISLTPSGTINISGRGALNIH